MPTAPKTFSLPLPHRPRRNRRTTSIRHLTQENWLLPQDLIMPLFITSQLGAEDPIPSLPGQFCYGPDRLIIKIREIVDLGILGIALFPRIEEHLKDAQASESRNKEGLIPQVIKKIKKEFPELLVISDVAMDPYSSDGHDGILSQGKILNDETLLVLGEMALVQAQAGADYVAPSDMMDGRIAYIRQKLDQAGFTEVGIIAYSAKYASCFYGPFREALKSAPKSGDKKSYQLNPGNQREALREIHFDEQEGADIILIKPAMSFLDIIALARQQCELPIAAYNVSGEYAMIKAAVEKGWLNEKYAVLESLLSMKRAGADIIFTYWAVDVVRWLSTK